MSAQKGGAKEVDDTATELVDDDKVLCECCGRSFGRALWYAWPIVPGRELDCLFCCLSQST